MNNLIDGVSTPPLTLNMFVTENVEFILKEIEAIAKPVNSLKSSPIYKTLLRLNFQSFFERFGTEQTKLYRLTKTQYFDKLPELLVIHTVPTIEESCDHPLLVEDKMFISHQYFKNWLIADDKDFYEKEILELILTDLDSGFKNTSN